MRNLLIFITILFGAIIASLTPEDAISRNFVQEQSDAKTTAKTTSPPIISPEGVIQVVEARTHACMLVRTGGVKCWGANTYGALLGNGEKYESNIPVDVVGLTSGVKKLAAGPMNTCALTVDGAVKCWGENQHGELGNGLIDLSNGIAQTVNGLSSGVNDITAYGIGFCVLMTIGSVQCWGVGVGDGTFEIRTSPVEVIEVANASQIDGGGVMCALVNGMVKCWGGNSHGEIGDGTTENRASPTNVSTLSNQVTQIAVAELFACALENGGVKCWGFNGFGHLGAGITDFLSTTPLPVIGLEGNVQQISATSEHACALKTDGSIYCWGYNTVGQVGDGSFRNFQARPVKMMNLFSNVSELATFRNATCVRQEQSDMLCLGHMLATPMGIEIPGIVESIGISNTQVSAGGLYTCAVSNNSAATCWGSNPDIDYEVGDKLESNILPKGIAGLESNVEMTAVGVHHSCALLKDGLVKCWRSNKYGQLGDGTRDNHTVAITVTGTLSNVVQIDVGADHSCALTASGGVKCWGNGYLAWNGSFDDKLTPIDITGVTSNVVQIDVGYEVSCALLKDGSVKCWGSGILGNGIPDPTDPSPMEAKNVINLEAPAKQVSVGVGHACVLLSNGKVKCWGYNNTGLLGNPTADVVEYAPIEVIGLDEDLVQLSAGGNHSCVLNSRGGMRCWGEWGASGLGGSSTEFKRDVPNLTNVVQITAGGAHTCARIEDGTIKCWGDRLALGNMPVNPVWVEENIERLFVFLPVVLK